MALKQVPRIVTPAVRLAMGLVAWVLVFSPVFFMPTPAEAEYSLADVGPPPKKGPWDDFTAGFFCQFLGPSLNSITTPRQPDMYGNPQPLPAGAIGFDSTLFGYYKLTDSITMGAGLDGFIFPVYGQGITREDPYVRIGDSRLIKYGNFTYGADLRFYYPLSGLSHDQDNLGHFRTVQLAAFDIPGTKLTITNYGSVYYYFYGPEADALRLNANGFGDWVAFDVPGLSYQAFNSLGFWTGYEMDTHHMLGDETFSWQNDGTYLYLGLSWDVTAMVNFSPFLAMRPGANFGVDNTEIQAYITAKFF